MLWKQDLHATYHRFLEGQPTQRDCSTQVERFIETEKKVGKGRGRGGERGKGKRGL